MTAVYLIGYALAVLMTVGSAGLQLIASMG